MKLRFKKKYRLKMARLDRLSLEYKNSNFKKIKNPNSWGRIPRSCKNFILKDMEKKVNNKKSKASKKKNNNAKTVPE
ncbi:hypothetical protein AYI70_g12037 [Smittium culicis]|uniref:Uncharacterized protein n=1 Tax=Smittium culicis TaxID=133412 RepID=A0A1R1WZ55_9FUNG|nr:hypothetical protein AYI70_g12037 [Smittium culicis]